jgi:hypothetical protein
MLVKLVCERCFAMYGAELKAEGWIKELPGEETSGGICSMCGRVEGKRTIQFNAAEVLDSMADQIESKKKKEP